MPPNRRPVFLFAPGAGASSSHPWMIRWAKMLKAIGKVVAFDYPYVAGGRRRPDRLPKLIEGHRAALAKVRRSHKGAVVLIGKSMGGRVGCHVALEDAVAAVICLGYPLCGGGDCTKLRDQVLRELTTPILFVQGTRDSLCPLVELARVRGEMSAINELYIVKGGDHSLVVTKTQLKASGKTQDELDLESIGVIRRFLAKHARWVRGGRRQAARSEGGKTVEGLSIFVSIEQVDPLLFYKPYFLEGSKGATKPTSGCATR